MSTTWKLRGALALCSVFVGLGCRPRVGPAHADFEHVHEVKYQPLLDPELQQAMELCVSCKGCKRECESNVDMPLIKAEYLSQKYQNEPRSLRSSLFANLPEQLHPASPRVPEPPAPFPRRIQTRTQTALQEGRPRRRFILYGHSSESET